MTQTLEMLNFVYLNVSIVIEITFKSLHTGPHDDKSALVDEIGAKLFFLLEVLEVIEQLLTQYGLVMPYGDIDLDQHCSGNVLMLDRAKPLPKQMLTYQ